MRTVIYPILQSNVPLVADATEWRKYQPEAVQRFIQTFDELPPGRVARSEAIVVDTVTHIHRTHIGDARSGKWRELAPAAQVEITKRFEPFLRAFDYPI
jgi:hypothetical protein